MVCVTESMQVMVRSETRFWNMSHDYYEGLADLDYGEKGGGPGQGASFVRIVSLSLVHSLRLHMIFFVIPRIDEVCNSVGRMIQLMQADGNGADLSPEEKRWLAPVPYELKKMNRPGAPSIAMQVCCSPLLLCGVGRRTYRELWDEG
jgi:hypothetical protein